MAEQLIVAVWRAPKISDRTEPWYWDLVPASRRFHTSGYRRVVVAMGTGQKHLPHGRAASHQQAVIDGLAALAERAN